MKYLLALLAALVPPYAAAAELPQQLDLAPPFPHVIFQAPTIEHIAPGVQYGDYELWCDDGPISVHVVAANLNDPDVRAGTVLANDVLGPSPETVSSMADRTGAIAGINGDYFDIGRTNQPTNVVVRDGMLLRTPRKRYALAILRSGAARFVELSFNGSVRIGMQTLALGAVNALASNPGEIVLLTPTYGPVGAEPGVTLVGLQPMGGVPFGAYRVTSFAQDDRGAQAGYYLALGSDAAAAQLPETGDLVDVGGSLAPLPLDEIASAVGGGPLILRDGRPFDDPDGPNGGAFDGRIPTSGAAIRPDGSLLLIEVDGRQPERSVGLTRPEFAALMLALGARDGMAFDGGGSSEIAVQTPGDAEALLVSSPSGGMERSVADGIFIYNAAAAGAASSVAADPPAIRAIIGAHVPLRVQTVDASDHPVATQAPVTATVDPATLGTIAGGRFTATHSGTGEILLQSGSVSGTIPVSVHASPARIVIVPAHPNLDPRATLALQVRAFDARGYELALPPQLHWSASTGSIDGSGTFTAADRDADVSVAIGNRVAFTRISVGSHEAPPAKIERVAFLTFPHGGEGSAALDPSCGGCVRLQYALGPDERAAYAVFELRLPDDTVGLSFDLQDDGSGALLRVALRSAIEGQILVTATTLTRPGMRHVIVRFPSASGQPLRLVGFYTIATKRQPQAKGEIVIGNVRALVAGRPSL